MPETYGDRSLAEFVESVAARTAAPGGGSVTAVTVALAAGLTAMAVRFSAGRPGVDEAAAAQADKVRLQALHFADSDAAAYTAVLAALRLPRDADGVRRVQLREALTAASDLQIEVAEAAVTVARIAAELTVSGKPDVRGDARSGLLLAEAAVRSAAQLVEANVSLGGCEQRFLTRTADLVATAQELVHSAA